MKRKLVKQGSATMMISLPSKWIKSNKLDKGDEISLEEVNNTLIISRDNNIKTETKIKLSSSTESHIRTLVTNAYRAGYDIIKVEYNNSNQLKILSDVIKKRLIGFEITKKEESLCIITNITEPSADQFDAIMQKMFANIKSLFETTRIRIGDKTANKDELEDYEEIEERIQKFDNFCRRVVSKDKMSEKREFLWTFLTLIIHGQREIYLLNKLFPKNIETSTETRSLLLECKVLFELIEKAYSEKSKDILERVHDKEKEIIYKKGYNLLQKSKGKETIMVYHILAGIRNFYQSNSPLFGLLI